MKAIGILGGLRYVSLLFKKLRLIQNKTFITQNDTYQLKLKHLDMQTHQFATLKR